ncbi:cytochrome P450 [Xylaria arbuscula]|nr:cytochrome P450 [Xylaria arbuscula]
METLPWIMAYWNYVASITLAYGVALALHRLFFHPLSRFPGPKLAAITRWYEAYYDVLQNGQYTFKIAEMHKKYGPIIRISPYELHVSDPAFFDVLYRQDGRWDKYAWAVDAFTAGGSTIFLADHAIHRARRQPLSHYFSKGRVASRQEVLQRHQRKLLVQISNFVDRPNAINLGAAVKAFTRDVANEYILDKDYNSLGQEEFDAALSPPNSDSGHIWRITKHVRWFGPFLTKVVPRALVMKTADKGMKSFFKMITEHQEDTVRLMSTPDVVDASGKDHRTVIHAIMASKLPPQDKETGRIFEDVSTVVGAGTGTTAAALRLILVNIFSNPKILARLRAELDSLDVATSINSAVDVESINFPDVKVLEQLPFLTSVLMEGLRLSPAIASRMTRIAPDRELHYNNWRIPAGTPVGMTTILMHTDETLYPEPHRFDPDRWVDLDKRRELEKFWAPFGKGTRNCVGMHLAWAEMYLVVATLVLRYDFRMEAKTEDFLCSSDQFAIGTKSNGFLKALVSHHRA